MAHKKRSHSTSPQQKPSKVPLAPSTKTRKTPPPIEQADGSPKPTEKEPLAATKVDDDSASSTLRCYNIPDYRLEHPEFRIFMSGEGSGLEYRIEGDLSAAAAADSRLEVSVARTVHRSLSLDAAEPPHGSRPGKPVQARQSGGRRLFRPGPGGLLVRFGAARSGPMTGSDR